MKKESKVKCVKPDGHALMEGKTYEVVSYDDIFIDVRNDQGNVVAYFRDRFSNPLEEESAFNSGDLAMAMLGGNRVHQGGKLG
jgi:hypothetical protein